MNEVDETITSICKWIQMRLKEDKTSEYEVQEMTKALAELVTGRTIADTSVRKSDNETVVNTTVCTDWGKKKETGRTW